MGVVAAILFAGSIVCLVECEVRLFPKAVTAGGAVVAILLALACIGIAFFGLTMMNVHGSPVVNWAVSGLILVAYLVVRAVMLVMNKRSA